MSHAKRIPSGRISRDGARIKYVVDTLPLQLAIPIIAASSARDGPESLLGRPATERGSQKHTYTAIFYKAGGIYP